MNDDLIYLKHLAFDKSIYDACKFVLEDDRFAEWSGSGSPENHHYGDGGLLQHTAEVVRLCEMTLKTLPCKANPRVLFTAAIWHDYGKIWDYQKNGDVWSKSNNHARTIHHISRSVMEYHIAWGSDTEFDNAIVHCILSHHGRREWGSPVEPLSEEAWILHLCDNLSARVNDCHKVDRLKVKGDSRSYT